ncbi:MAG TPA: cytochrome c biogenesis protein CcsA [Candidatus Acidoferrum sp.]|jgi:ABC-type transport system involved in cytochrome c biogenesis permease subunit
MNHLFFLLTLAAYVGSFAAYVAYLVAGHNWAGRLGSLLLAGGLVTHYFALLERSRGLHTVPYHDLSGSMSLFGWLLALTYLSLELFHRQRSVGAFVLPFVLAFFIFAQSSPADRLAAPPATGVIFALHVTLSILAYAAFGLSCVLSVIYLAEQRLLHQHKVGDIVWRLPSLDLLDRMSQSSVLVGLISIAIGTVLGFVWVDRLSGNLWHADPKYVVTLLVLVAYAFYLRLARNPSWRGARASQLCIFNFAIVIFSFTVVNLFFSHAHRYF